MRVLLYRHGLVMSVGAAALASLSCPPAWADPGAPSSNAAAIGIGGGPNPEQGIVLGSWILYPSLMVGTVFNDNIYSTASNRKSGLGLRLRPSFEADLDTGIHKSTVYFNADAQIYPGKSQSYTLYPTYSVLAAPSNITGRAGFSHAYSPLPDLTFTLIGDYTRNNGLFGSTFGASAPQSSIMSAAALAGNGTVSNQFTGSLSVDKKLTERAFFRASTGVQYVTYDSQPTNRWLSQLVGVPLNASSNLRNGLSYTASVRGGYWITPQLYAFVEPGADLRRYQNSWSDTNGYKIIGGFGSDLISLFRGEIYGGYQNQASVSGRFPSTSAPAFGGRLYYYPTRDLAFTATVDQTFTAPVAQAQTFFNMPIGYIASAPSRTTQARLQADYAITPYWTTFARAGYGISRSNQSVGYSTAALLIPGANPVSFSPATSTRIWTAGTGMSYTFWRNVAVNLEYQFSQSTPSQTSALLWWVPRTITQNLVTAGVTYKY